MLFNNLLKEQLDRLLQSYVTQTQRSSGHLPTMELNNSIPDQLDSLAVVEANEQENTLYWKPAENGNWDLLNGLEKGLDTEIHSDIKTYFGAYWSNGICCLSPIGPVSLIQIWNKADLELLRENLLGHAFMKLKKRQPLTFFAGLGEGENVVVVDNATGIVYLEQPGRRPHKTLAGNLAEFLQGLEVTLTPYSA